MENRFGLAEAFLFKTKKVKLSIISKKIARENKKCHSFTLRVAFSF